MAFGSSPEGEDLARREQPAALGQDDDRQGRENAKSYLKDNPEVAERIERAIRGHTDQVAEALMVGPDGEDE